MIGLFAGRGDVIVAMLLAGLIGVWIGWNSRKIIEWMRRKEAK